MSNAPLFTIVTPTYNAAATLGDTLASVYAQDNQDNRYEYRIIDGASTDMTSECVHAWQDRFGDALIFSSQPDKGIYDAMNKGLAAARGRYILFLGADDRLEPEALALAVRELVDSNADCLAGACRAVWPDSCGGSEELRLPRPDMTTCSHPTDMPTIHQAWIARTELLRTAGGFNLAYPIAADYELFLRLQEEQPCPKWAFTDRPLARFALGGTSFAIADTARDYRRARISHGRTRLSAYALYTKNILASHFHRLTR